MYGRSKRHKEDRADSSIGSCLEHNFKAPPHCGSEPHPECMFTLNWNKIDNDMIEFTLVASVAENTSVWAAVGFSGNSQMVSFVCIAVKLRKMPDSR